MLEAKFDLREWPEGKDVSELTSNVCWILRVFSNDTTGLVRDTEKEDKEAGLKKSWEDSEAGRAERAKKAR